MRRIYVSFLIILMSVIGGISQGQSIPSSHALIDTRTSVSDDDVAQNQPRIVRSYLPFVQKAVSSNDPWSRVRAVLDTSELDDFVVLVGTENGTVFSYSRGQGTETTSAIPIASASKWWTGAVILSLVEEGRLALDDHPQDYISWWTDDPADPRSQVTLAQLVSMTAGFRGEPACMIDPNTTLDACVRIIYDNFHQDSPGTVFYYSSTHMHVAALMVTLATEESFAASFRRTIGEPLGMTEQTTFALASTANPWPAGGGVSSPQDYVRFQRALLTGEILPTTRERMFADRTAAPVSILFSPISPLALGVNAEWHYGLGVWLECSNTTWTDNCLAEQIYSSGGGWGWFPWIDEKNGYYGLVARFDPATGAAPSVELALELRPLIIEALQVSGD